MYQGKFANKSSSRRKQPAREESIENQVPQGNEVSEALNRRQPAQAPAPQAACQPVQAQVPQTPRQPVQTQAPRQMVRPQTPERERMFREQPQTRPQTPRQDPSQWERNPADLQLDLNFQNHPQNFQENYGAAGFEPESQPEVVVKKRWKGRLIGGFVFYFLLLAAIGVFYLSLQEKLDTMTDQLKGYEQKQPGFVSNQVFEQIFADPDWAVIYDNAKVQVSQFENKDAFVQFMDNKVGNKDLSMRVHPDGGDSKLLYDVFLDNEKVASFGMVNGSSDPEAPAWKMDGIQVYFEAEENYRIRCTNGHVVKVNDVALDDSFLVERAGKRFTEDLGDLSKHARLPGTAVYEVENFLVKPRVTIEDGSGKQMEVSFDQETRTFSEPEAAEGSIPDEARDLALNAVTTYCEYMIKKTNMANLMRYFNPNTRTYQAIISSDLTWIQTEKGHSTANEKVTDFVRLGEDAFSIRVSLTWQLTRQDDSVKESPVDVTLLFEKNENGNYQCTRMTGVEFVDDFRSVRLRFMQHGDILEDKMVSADAKAMVCPKPKAVEGKRLAGWVTIRQDEAGKDFYQRVLAPDEKGNAVIPEGLLDQPLELWPVYAK